MTKNLSKVIIIFLFDFIFVLNFMFKSEQQFSYLANSFLNGKLFFLTQPLTWNDTTFFNGNYFWPLGPFPSIVLTPFVYVSNLFGIFFSQGYLQFFIVVGVFLLIQRIAKTLKYSTNDAFFWAFAFCFASVFLGVSVVPYSWYFSQVITVFLMFLSLYEYLTKKRYFFLGITTALIYLTRSSAALVVVLFLLDIFVLNKEKIKSKLADLAKLTAPIILAVVLLFNYNYARFGNIWEIGYSNQMIPEETAKAREYGIFSLAHLPGNLYYFLLAAPTPVFRDKLSHVLALPYIFNNPWGVGIIFTSPYLIYLFFINYKEQLLKILLITSGVIAIPIFLYYGIGFRQFGYRYSLDFLPLLFLILIKGYKDKHNKLSLSFKTAIITSSIFNMFIFITFFFDLLT